MTDNLGSSGLSISEGIRDMVLRDHALGNGPWEVANLRQSLFSFKQLTNLVISGEHPLVYMEVYHDIFLVTYFLGGWGRKAKMCVG